MKRVGNTNRERQTMNDIPTIDELMCGIIIAWALVAVLSYLLGYCKGRMDERGQAK